MGSSLKNRLLAGALMLGVVFSVSAAEIFSSEAFLKSSKSVKYGSDGIAYVDKSVMVQSPFFPVDQQKKYHLSVAVKADGGANAEKSWVLAGYNVFDKNKVRIESQHVFALPTTLSTVAAPAAKGDSVVLVKGGTGFCTGSLSFVTGAKADLSDLPNRNVVSSGVSRVEKTADGWKITLKGKLLKDLPAGTSVRQHRMGGYVYAAGHKMVGNQWVTLQGSTKGMVPNFGGRLWPTGTAYARAVLLLNWDRKKVNTQIKDFSLTAE